MMTIGQLVALLFAKYEKQFNDDQELAAVATQIELDKLLRRQANQSKVAPGAATSLAR